MNGSVASAQPRPLRHALSALSGKEGRHPQLTLTFEYRHPLSLAFPHVVIHEGYRIQ